MELARILAYVTGTVDQELLARNEYLAAENRILKAKLKGRLKLSDAERATLGEIGHRLGRKALADVATVARTLRFQPVSESGTSRRRQKPKIHVRFWSASHKRATASSGVLPEPMHQVLVADHSWSLSLREERSRNLSGTNANTAAMRSSRVGMNQFSTSAASPRE